MKQIFQNLKDGTTVIEDTPCPATKANNVLIETSCSLVSLGTERMLIEFGKSNLLQKAKSQPEKVKEVLQKIKTDGVVATKNAVLSKLEKPIPLGYCNVGKVLQTDGNELSKGMRVVSNGSHAEIVRVPYNLVACIPDQVSDETASFTVVGAIALQGIRLLNTTLGETVVVIGLGLIGMLSVQILKASGCNVIGTDTDTEKCILAEQFGAIAINLSNNEDPILVVNKLTNNIGVDSVLITASSPSHEIISQSAMICRKRGKIVLIGVVGLNLQRSDFYEKEITFQVSCSYGPGRYDRKFEEEGQDYPIAYVRWTAQRNFTAILKLMENGAIQTEKLITESYLFKDALKVYDKINNKHNLGILLKYQSNKSKKKFEKHVNLKPKKPLINSENLISFIGGGNYASQTLIPAFYNTKVHFDALVTSSGLGSLHIAKKFNFNLASTEINDAFLGKCNSVVIATQHHLHASQVIQALKKK